MVLFWLENAIMTARSTYAHYAEYYTNEDIEINDLR